MGTSRQILTLIIFIIVCLGIGFLGSFATAPNIEGWYAELSKPSWTPPSGIFGPVWTILYIAMAVAAWLVWRELGTFNASPMYMFIFQLVLNLAWSWLFFGLKNPVAGFVDIAVLWVAILVTMVMFWRISLVAGILFVPYILWVTFASALNFSIMRLNS